MFFQWNSKVGWRYRYNNPLIPSDGTSIWNSSWNGNGATIWEKANDPCPSGWRMPSQSELNALMSSGSVWTTENGMNGRRFGSGSNTLFLPAVGTLNYYDGTQCLQNSWGGYWSSTQDINSNAHVLSFNSDSVYLDSRWVMANANGFSCHCVAE